MADIDRIMSEEGFVPPAIPVPQIDASLPNTIKFTWPAPSVSIKAESIWKDRQGIHCLLSFWTEDNGVILGPERINLQSTSAKGALLRQLREREERPWAEYLQHVVWLTSEHLKNDGETLTAASYTPKPEPPWLVWPLVKADVVNMCFADGGAGKSTLYAAVCLSGAAGQSVVPGLRVSEAFTVLYVDFEASADDVIGAADMLAAGAGLSPGWRGRFVYRRMGGSLADNIETIQRIVVEHDVKLVVIDSLIGSAGSDPNDAETARVFFAASNSLPGCAIVGLTHVSKGSEDSPLGSVMYRNLPRIVWQMKRDEDSDTVGLYPNKINTLGERPQPFALSLLTSEESMRYVSANMSELPSLSVKMKISDQMAHLLRHGAMSVDDIAKELGKPTGTIRKTLSREQGKRFIHNATTGEWGSLRTEDDGATERLPPVRGATVASSGWDMSRDKHGTVAQGDGRPSPYPGRSA